MTKWREKKDYTDREKKLKFFLYFCVRGPENVMAVSKYKDLSKELKICVTWMFPNLEIPMGRKIKVSRLSLLKISCIILACSEKSVLPLVILMTNHVGKCPRLLWTELCSHSEEEGFASSVFDNMKVIGVHIGRLMRSHEISQWKAETIHTSSSHAHYATP